MILFPHPRPRGGEGMEVPASSEPGAEGKRWPCELRNPEPGRGRRGEGGGEMEVGKWGRGIRKELAAVTR